MSTKTRYLVERAARIKVSLTLLLILLGIGLFGVRKYLDGNISNDAIIPAASIFVGVTGWIINNIQSKIAQAEQHTLNILFDTRLSPTWQEHRQKVDSAFPPKRKPIDPEVVMREGEEELRESVKFVGNYYEFLAAAVRFGNLDEPLLRECIRSQFVGFFWRIAPYVAAVRSEQKSSSYNNFEWLARRWDTNGYIDWDNVWTI